MKELKTFSGMKVIKAAIDYLRDSLELGIKNRVTDNFENGICKNELNEFSFISTGTLLNVSTGVAYTNNTLNSSDNYNERIIIDNDTLTYSLSATITTTYDGISNYKTPQSTGCKDIPLTPSVINYVWIRYLQTIDPTIFTLHYLTDQKQFYETGDGYEIIVTTTNPVTLPPTAVDGNEYLYLGSVNGTTADYTGRTFFKLKERRAKIVTPLSDLSDRTATYTLNMVGFLDDHIKCISNTATSGVTGTMLVSPNNPHGTTIYDCGFSNDFKVSLHNQIQHTSGIIKNLDLLVEASLLPVEIPGTGAANDAIGITKLDSTEYVVVDGNIISSSTNLGIDSGTGLWQVNLPAVTGLEGFYVYLDKTDNQLKLISNTDVTFKGYPVAGNDYAKLVICEATLCLNGSTQIQSLSDRRVFGTISKRDVQEGLPPIGAIEAYAGSTDPVLIDSKKTWLICDGRVLNVKDYPQLYITIGTTWGGVVGATFCIPDLRDRTIMGKSVSKALGTTGGSDTHHHTLDTSGSINVGTHEHTVPNHVHYMQEYESTYEMQYDAAKWVGRTSSGYLTYSDTAPGNKQMQRLLDHTRSDGTVATTGGGYTVAPSLSGYTAYETALPKYGAMNWIIKYK